MRFICVILLIGAAAAFKLPEGFSGAPPTGPPPSGMPPRGGHGGHGLRSSGAPPSGAPPSGTPPTLEASKRSAEGSVESLESNESKERHHHGPPTGPPPSGMPPRGPRPSGPPPSGVPPSGPPATRQPHKRSAEESTESVDSNESLEADENYPIDNEPVFHIEKREVAVEAVSRSPKIFSGLPPSGKPHGQGHEGHHKHHGHHHTGLPHTGTTQSA